MKTKIILLTAVIFCNAALHGQGIDDGLKMMKYQRYQSAIEIFKKLAAVNNDDDNAAYWLGIAKIRNKNTAEAITYYNQTGEKLKRPLLLGGLANAYAAAGKKNDALKTLSLFDKGAEAITEEDIAAAIGRVYTELKDFSKAETYYKRAAAINKTDPENYYLLGTNSFKKADGTAAYKYFNQAISMDSNYAPAYFSLAKIFISQKAIDLYLPYLKKTVAKDSLYTPAWFELYRYAYYNDKKNSKNYYTRYLQFSDKTEKQQYQLLVLDFNEKKYKSVIEKAKLLLQEEDSDVPVEIYKYLGFSYFQMNNLKQAYKSITQYIEVQDSAKLKRYDFYLVAQVAARIKEKDSIALSYIINEFNADTTSANRKYYAIALVNHYVRAKDDFNAALWSEKLLSYKGMNKVDLYRIGVTWYNINELDRADSVLTEFVKNYPAEYKGIYMKAGILAKKDSTMSEGLAVPWFENFIDSVGNTTKAEYKPMLEQSYSYLGGYHLKQKDYTGSLDNYSNLLKLQPYNKEVKNAITEIKNYLQKLKVYEKNKNKKGN